MCLMGVKGTWYWEGYGVLDGRGGYYGEGVLRALQGDPHRVHHARRELTLAQNQTVTYN